MLTKLRERHENEDEGFTLIELMVVVLIIAILLAIAIPTFLGARNRANDRAAQSSLRNALTAAKTIYTDSQNYTEANQTKLLEVEPSLSYQTAASDDYKTVSVSATISTWGGAALSKTGTCFVIRDLSGAGGGTQYGTDSACTGAAALTAATASKW